MKTARGRRTPLELSLAELFLRSRDGESWRREHWGAVACWAGAALAGLLGLSVTAAIGLGLCRDDAGDLTRIAALIMVSAMALTMLGAACLDRLESRLFGDLRSRPLPAPADTHRASGPRRATGHLGPARPRPSGQARLRLVQPKGRT